jgi:hypothetical protein
MIINLPKITKALKISDYVPGSEEEIRVWVNPPVKLLQEYDATIKQSEELIQKAATVLKKSKLTDALKHKIEVESEEAGKKQIEILSEQLIEGSRDTDPMFWLWLKNKTAYLIAEHRYYIKKD